MKTLQGLLKSLPAEQPLYAVHLLARQFSLCAAPLCWQMQQPWAILAV